MKKSKLAAVLLASAVAVSATCAAGCNVSTNNSIDMAQVIATVNVSKAESFKDSGLENYSGAVKASDIIKRDLVAYFLNVGQSYLNNNPNTTYKEVFTQLVNALIENAVLTQYSTMYLLSAKAEAEGATAQTVVNAFNAFETDAERYIYLLGEDSKEVKIAKYNLFTTLNKAIDNNEKEIIDDEEEERGSDTRTTPTGVDAEQEDYYPKKGGDGADKDELNYNVYIGYEGYLINDSGIYKDEDAIDGTTSLTRKQAYNEFLSSLRENFLIEADEMANVSDIMKLSYIQNEYVTQLESQVIQKYYDVYEEEMAARLTKNDDGETDYAYLQKAYDNLLSANVSKLTNATEMTTAMDSMSNSSFVLYAPKVNNRGQSQGAENNEGRFGFVYNILLPFSAAQSADLASLDSQLKDKIINDNQYYIARNELLKNIRTTDQRAAWFNGATEYAFDATDSGINYYGKDAGKNYLFFENNLTDNVRYQEIEKYAGTYPYNGKVSKASDETYVLNPNYLDIDAMLEEFVNYVDYVMGNAANTTKVTNHKDDYYNVTDFYKTGSTKDFDYSKFVYAEGKVDLGVTDAQNRNNLLFKESSSYKALSAVNELQYAYTTDTSVLSTHVGYSVSADTTNYVKEFEYAAKTAVENGAGSFVVCSGQYGWHLIYVTYAFDAATGDEAGTAQYNPDWAANIDKEGTFENLFFEWMKGNDLSNTSTLRKAKIISDFNTEATVVKYESRYKDLLEMDNN